MSSDVEDELVIAPPDDTLQDEDFDGAAGDGATGKKQDQGETSYAAEDEYKDDIEGELEPEASTKDKKELDEETSYQDDFEQSIAPGVSKMPDEDEDPDLSGAAIDEPVRRSSNNGPSSSSGGAAILVKSTSAASRTSSAAGSRPGSAAAAATSDKSSSAAKPSAPVASHKAAAAPKPAATAAPKLAATKPAPATLKPVPVAAPKPVSLKPAVSKPSAPAPKLAVPPGMKPAVPRVAPAAAKPAALKPEPEPVVSARPTVPPRNMAPLVAAPPPLAPTAVGPAGQKVKLTFTGPPNTARAAPTVKPDYSHSSYEVKKISSDNVKLCNRLVEISRAPPNPAYSNALSVGSAVVSGKLAPANVAAATVNRHRKDDKIAQENLALYKRLQTVKPTPTVNRELLGKDFVKSQAYGDNARKVKAPPAASTTSTSKGAAGGPDINSDTTRQPTAGSAEDVYSRPSRDGSVASGGGSKVEPVELGAGDLSTVMEGPEGETSDAIYADASAVAQPSITGGDGDDIEPEYSMDVDFGQQPSESFAV